MRDKSAVLQLTPQHFKLWQALEKGYSTQKEKFEELFFSQEPPDMKTVVAHHNTSEKVPSNNPPAKKKTTSSVRILSGRANIKIVYPRSGAVHYARIKTLGDLCAIEPIDPNTAFWVVSRKDIEGLDVVDLKYIPHIRQYHNNPGRIFLSEFR